ncbi:MarC family protein [Octadecabacter sp. R77987]|uniref:MarC family protein n=1 Tax=Octadecabacter sp. R77987 TaxID=3093874 RepID=UPI00366CE1D3
MEYAALITAFTTLFVIIDPPGLAPLFLALTQGMSAPQRRAIAIRASLVAIGILLGFGLFGEALLGFIGISMPAFRVAGGVLLFLTALDMLFERRQKRREDTAEEEEAEPDHDPSVFPLAVPLIAGPGAIATMILLVGQTEGALGFAALVAVLLAVMAINFAFFMASGLIERALGKTGINVITRLLGMLLAALAVQFILDGLRSFGFAA